MSMTDAEYAELRVAVEAAKETLLRHEDDVLAEAVLRDEAFVLHALYYHFPAEWPFFTLDGAVGRAEDDCWPLYISGPGGVCYDRDGDLMTSEDAESAVTSWKERK